MALAALFLALLSAAVSTSALGMQMCLYCTMFRLELGIVACCVAPWRQPSRPCAQSSWATPQQHVSGQQAPSCTACPAARISSFTAASLGLSRMRCARRSWPAHPRQSSSTQTGATWLWTLVQGSSCLDAAQAPSLSRVSSKCVCACMHGARGRRRDALCMHADALTCVCAPQIGLT